MTTLEEALRRIEGEAQELRKRQEHGGSRMVQAGADADVVDHIAKGGSVRRGSGEPVEHTGTYGTKSAARTVAPGSDGSGGSLAGMLLDVANKRVGGLARASDQKALAEASDSSGGYLLVPQLYDQVMPMIRAIPGVLKLNPTQIDGTSKRIDLPGLTNPSASASWTAENAMLPVTTESFAIVNSLLPHVLGTLLVSSIRLLTDASSNPSLEQVLRQDLANVMGTALDAALVNGTGVGQPKGLLATTGTTPAPGTGILANGGQVSLPLLIDIQSALRSANIIPSRPGWLMAPRTLGNIQRLTTSTGQPLMEAPSLLSINPDGVTGRLLGAPFAISGNLPTTQSYGTSTTSSSSIIYGDFAEMFYASWNQLSVDSSSEASYTPDGGTTWISTFQALQVAFRAQVWCDAQVRRGASFVIQQGITG